MTVAPGATFPVRPLELNPDRQTQKAPGSRTRTRSDDRTGRYVRPTLHKAGPPDLAIDATLRAAAPFQAVRERGNLALAITEPDLRYKVREKRIGRHILFVVDASGSMGADVRMAETKAAILSLLLDAYQKRERVGLIVFRGREAKLTLPFTHSVEMAQRHLTHLPTGGKTPLPHALKLAMEVLQTGKGPAPPGRLPPGADHRRPGQHQPGQWPRPWTKSRNWRRRSRPWAINSLILDTEAFAPCLDLGCLPELSRIMGGIYHSLATIRAPEMVATIEAALK